MIYFSLLEICLEFKKVVIMISREYKDSNGIWHNIEADDYDDMQGQIKTLDIAKQFLCTAKQAHLETEEGENILREIFMLISLDISAAIRYHRFDTYFSCGLDLKQYADDIIPVLKELGYQVEFKSNPERDGLYIKW